MVRHALVATAAVLAALSFGVAGCKKQEAAKREVRIPIETATVTRARIPLMQRAIGAVQPLRTVNIKSQVDGVISVIHTSEGQEVEAGALLVTLDQRPFRNAVAKARADLENTRAEATQAQRNAERYSRLAQASAISEEQESQLKTAAATASAKVAAQEATLANAELQLGYTEIRAPFAGRIGQFALHEGALVKANDAGSSLLTLHQLDPITVAFSIPDSRQAALRRAQAKGPVKVTVTPRDDQHESLDGEVTFVDNAIDPLTGTLTLKAQFTNGSRRLWPGAFVDVNLVLEEIPDAIVVPDNAVQTGQNGSQIWVVGQDSKAVLRPVKLGLRAGGVTQLLSGAEAGETVVTDGQLRLTPGAAVQTRSAETPVAPAAAATNAR